MSIPLYKINMYSKSDPELEYMEFKFSYQDGDTEYKKIVMISYDEIQRCYKDKEKLSKRLMYEKEKFAFELSTKMIGKDPISDPIYDLISRKELIERFLSVRGISGLCLEPVITVRDVLEIIKAFPCAFETKEIEK